MVLVLFNVPHLLFMLDHFYMVSNSNSIQINLNPDQVDFCAYLQFFVTLVIVHFNMAYQFHAGILLATILRLIHCFLRR